MEKGDPAFSKTGLRPLKCKLWLLIEGVRRLRARAPAER
jgi:hypothetical protein